MKKLKVNLGERSYSIIIGKGCLTKLKGIVKKLKLGKVIAVVTNPTINRLHGALMQKALRGSAAEVHFVEVPDSEESKSAQVCISLIERFAELDRGKGLSLIAFGGGVIGDLTGFCASVYRRGIPYIQVPTTLLAQVDSSIGGKTAIDLASAKNLIGSFYQPRLVLSELRFLSSLPEAQIKEALAEIIKYAIIADSRLFQFLEKNLEAILALEQKKIEYIVETCCRIKANVVEQDETDKKDKRIILNFGHTTAHALEAAAGYGEDYTHGYSVALGILVACEIARELKLIHGKAAERIEALIARAGLPTKISQLKLEDILKAQAHDKKFIGGKNRFVLPLAIGKTVVRENVSKTTIVKAIKSKMGR
ncbi:MAG: 3-dehydroquinate synthase [Candidatus Omnitrophota bacterium]|nr:MAG: 3-dehydroquinate synthase [Candidatus Omnitrophota bacterium]